MQFILHPPHFEGILLQNLLLLYIIINAGDWFRTPWYTTMCSLRAVRGQGSKCWASGPIKGGWKSIFHCEHLRKREMRTSTRDIYTIHTKRARFFYTLPRAQTDCCKRILQYDEKHCATFKVIYTQAYTHTHTSAAHRDHIWSFPKNNTIALTMPFP